MKFAGDHLTTTDVGGPGMAEIKILLCEKRNFISISAKNAKSDQKKRKTNFVRPTHWTKKKASRILRSVVGIHQRLAAPTVLTKKKERKKAAAILRNAISIN